MNINRNHIILAVVVLLIVGSIFYIDSQKVSRSVEVSPESDDINIEELLLNGSPDAEENNSFGVRNEIVDSDPNQMSAEERILAKKELFETAKEISTPDGFINTNAITISELIGKKIILVDFWTYSCINCQRTLPYLNSWYEKYADEGLVIIGIHTPEFEFEKEFENVERAVLKWEVEYPVVLDNDFSTWRAYKNRYWPRKYLIDIDGFIVYDHIGEGSYDITEAKIVELLNERMDVLGERGSIVVDTRDPSDVDMVDFRQVKTPEIYLGSSRLEFIDNLPSTDCFVESCEFAIDNPTSIPLSTYAIVGSWQINPEESVLQSETGSIFIRFSANKVNLVAGALGNIRAEIYLDGKLVRVEQAGLDVTEGIVTFTANDLYNLIDLQGNYGEHLLEVRFLDPGISAFAFTFG